MESMNSSDETRLSSAKRSVLASLAAHRGDVALSNFGLADGKPQCGASVGDAVPFGADSKARVVQSVAALTPSGNTPLAESLKRAYAATRDKPGAQILVVTDGSDTCDRSICAIARDEHGPRAKVVLHGVGMSGVDEDELGCLQIEYGAHPSSAVLSPNDGDATVRLRPQAGLVTFVLALMTLAWVAWHWLYRTSARDLPR